MIGIVGSAAQPPSAGAQATRAPAREPAAPPAAKPETERAVAPLDKGPALKQLEEEINSLIERLLASNLRLRIEEDTATGTYVYKGIDRETGEVKRQWPPEKILQLRAFFRALDGLLVDETA
jgi:flagellar protein FlaG